MAVVRQLFRRVEVDLAMRGQRNDIDGVAGELPRDDVAVMLELAEQHAIAAVARGALGDEVDRLGRAAREDGFVRRAADQFARRAARRLEALGHRRRALVDPAVDGRIVAAIGIGDGVDHRLRLLRGRGGIEIMPAGDRRELVAHVERGIEGHRRVHRVTSCSASRA